MALDVNEITVRLAIARKASRFGVVVWSPDGRSIAAAGGRDHRGFGTTGDGLVWLWRLDRQTPILLQGHTSAVTDVRWSPTGAMLASGSDDGTVRLWDAASARELWKLEGHKDTVWCLAWSSDGKLLASGAGDSMIGVWDVEAGAALGFLEHRFDINSLAWSPDCESIATGSLDGYVRLWNAETGRERRVLDAGRVTALAWSPDGRTIATGSWGGSLCFWDAAGWLRCQAQQPQDQEERRDSIWSVAWHGGRLASASEYGTVRLWDGASGREQLKLYGHGNAVWSVAWSPDGSRIASASEDQTVRVWDTASGRQLRMLEGHAKPILDVAWSPDGTIASASHDGTVRIWDADSGRESRRLDGHIGNIRKVDWSPDGSMVAGGTDDATWVLWDGISGVSATGHARRLAALTR